MFEPTKYCFKCKSIKPLSEFYKNRTKPDGLSNQCKICCKRASALYRQRPEYQEYIKTDEAKARAKEGRHRYRLTEKGKQARKRANVRFFESPKGKEARQRENKKYRSSPEGQFKNKARLAVERAVQYGKIPAPSTLRCSKCDNMAKDYHHYLGYEPEHWFDVIPLCKKCHTEAHYDLTIPALE